MSIDIGYSPIAPVRLLLALHKANLLGNYILLLAHDVNAHPGKYAALIRECSSRGKKPFIIMDNGTVELSQPLAANEVVRAAKLVDADCIVLPDVIGDSTATITRINRDLDILLASGLPLMRVPQGRNEGELRRTTEWLMEKVPPRGAEHNYWGVPRWLANHVNFGSRKGAVRMINGMHYTSEPTPKIHLLGMSSNLTDDIECCQMKNVIGIDSANPLVMGQDYRYLNRGDLWIHMDRGNYWDNGTLTTAVADNLRWIQHQIAGHY